MSQTDEVYITAEPQMDENVCKFHLDRPIYAGVYNCTGKDKAKGSPLLEALFDIDGVVGVMITAASVTVKKDSKDDWQKFGKKIGQVIREQLAAGGQLIDPNVSKPPSSEDMKKEILEVIEEEINPYLASHGGSCELVDLQGTTAFLTMSGGCQGCAAASYTLKNGIEEVLKNRIPSLTEVVDVTDHGSGTDPYYQ